MQVIEFDSETFGLAANNGQMIEEFSAKAKAAQQFRELALNAGAPEGAEGRQEEVGARRRCSRS